MWKRFVTNNGKVAIEDQNYRLVYLINSILFIFGSIFLFFTIADIMTGYYTLASNNFLGFIIASALTLHFHKTQNIKFAAYGVVAMFTVICVVFISLTKPHYYSYYWLTLFAPIAFFLLGTRIAAFFSTLFYGYFIVDMSLNLGVFEPSPFTFEAVFNITAVTIALICLAYYYELSRGEAQERLKALNDALQDKVKAEVAKRMEAEEARQQEREALIQSDKMAQFGNMLGVILHQWKQPLSIISLYAQEIKACYKDDELTQEHLDETVNFIMENISFMCATSNEFRNFYKPSKEKKLFLAAQQIEQVWRLLQKQLTQSGIELIMDADYSLAVIGFEGEFKQVILNLINNAKDAFEDRKIKNAKIEISVKESESKVLIELSDNAGGVPEELLPSKLFEMFSSTKGDNGTGIGLAICRVIIEENMQGSLSVCNDEFGARFKIELPLARAY